MTTLLIAEHDNASIKDSTNKALTAAAALGADVHVLVAGENAKAAADAAARLAGVKKVLLADNAAYAHDLATRRPFDLVQVHDWLTGVAGVSLKYAYKVPLVTTIHATERGRHQGSEKLPPCNMAILQIEVTDGKNTTSITHRLFLHAKTEGMLCEFFTAIGQRKHGEKLQMNWNKVSGFRGRCKVVVEPYKGTDYNNIKRFYEYDAAKMTAPTVQPQGAYSPGTF